MKYFEDADVNDTFSSRTPYLVSAAEIKEFAGQWDPQRYHLDEAAAEKIVGALFAPLALTMCIAIKLTHQSGFFEIEPVAGLGLEDVRLLKPVLAGDELHVKITVVAKRDSNSKPDLGLITQRTDVLNQNDEMVFSYVIPTLVYKRPQ